MGVTTNDIARICNVSRTTVIRALNDQGRISSETKERILNTAKELGYRPDLLARGLVKGKTMSIGVVVYDVRNQYFAQMLSAIEEEAQTRGYCVNITLHGKDREREIELIRRLVDYRVDGLILSPVNKGREFGRFLKSLNTPLVVVGNRISDTIPFVGIDEKKAAKEAAQKILASSYERVVFVCPPLAEKEMGNIYTHEQRLEGFEEVMKNYPGIEKVVIGAFGYEQEVLGLLENSKKRTAFFCSGDIFALDIIKVLKRAGKRAPSDYGIMGFDNLELLEYMEPSLSTIHNSVPEVSRKAVELLFDKMEGREIPLKTYENYRLIHGNTI
ncbi:LacI family DNA-binding transcriptional regulator [Kineothrix sp. MB12-C1]|uniref:LacI family DNA-binding transcriptional regulator n=1 Tax=Kineothrix sp. MB12-C1 TaxID=3070215 RepID=UPI0027D2C5C3|nr:LacI family DNA-binding transcriptional regulator [Kineothrix sp. MB12-C1]WMC91577.1 LacI family DNA-binding transcriptional regulator [Kineothrix sp. MB12-C1]